MDKKLLLKYIAGEISEEERREVIDWMDADPANKSYFLDLKNIWVSQNMPGTKASQEELSAIMHLKENRTLSGNNPGSDNDRLKRKLSIYRRFLVFSSAVAAIAIILLVMRPLVVAEKYDELKSGMIEIAMSEVPEEFRHTIYTERGVKGHTFLPDGTEVWINSDSRLVVPEKFIGATREVYLEGEAYFKVISDSIRPMIVRTAKNVYVKVKGTEFNLKSYNNDDYVETTLYSGKIDLAYISKNGKETVIPVLPLEKAVFAQSEMDIVRPEEPEDESAWKEGMLVFNATPMGEVIKQLERWYGVNVRVTDKSVLKYPISATFTKETVVQVMNMIKYCALIDYSLKDKDLEIFGRK